MISIKKILYPTDFSDCADSALRWALLLARYLNVELDMLHVGSAPSASEDAETFEHFPGQHACEALLQNPDEFGLTSTGEVEPLRIKQVIRHGDSISQEIINYAGEEDSDLIVLGTHGSNGLNHLLLGSVAEQLVRRAPCPIITIRERRAREPLGVKRIILPVDFSEDNKIAVKYALVLAKLTGARLHLIHVVEPRGRKRKAELNDKIKESLVKDIHEFMSECQVLISYQVHIEAGKPYKKIVELSDEEPNGLVVIASHGVDQEDKQMLGSTTDRVVRSAFSPILTVRSDEKQFVR